MRLTSLACVLFAAACCCASALAQPAAAEAPACGPAERMALAPIAERGIAELRGFLFAKGQLDQLALYLESKEGAVKWAGATAASRVKLMQAAARSATNSSAAITQLPFLPATRYAFEAQLSMDCARSAQLLARLREPGFTRYLELRARVAAAAAAWYANGLFAKLPHQGAAPVLQPFVAAPGDVPARTRPAAKKTPAKKQGPGERQMLLVNRLAAVDALLRDIGLFDLGMTAIEGDFLYTGAAASAPTALVNEAAEVLADPGLKALLQDPAYLAFNHAVLNTAHKAELTLLQDYPRLEALGRNVSQAWVADFLRAAPKPLPPEQRSPSVAPIAPEAPVAPAAPKP